MDYRELFKAENDEIMERYDLSMERINAMLREETAAEPYRSYFKKIAEFVGMIEELVRKLSRDELEHASFEELQQWNQKLYQDVIGENYETSYANPAYAVQLLGDGLGQLLAFLYTEIRGDIVYAYESRLTDITIQNEVLIEIYNLFEESVPSPAQIKDVLYWFVSDYCDVTLTYRIRELVDPELSFAKDIIMGSDLDDMRFLYRFGEFVDDSQLKTAAYLSSLPQETIDKMADTYTEGYRKGFEVMGRDLSKKKTVVIRYELGFERMVRKAVENFRDMGLEPIIYRAPVNTMNRNPNRKTGYYGGSPSKQYDYDHRYDSGLYLDKALKERKLSVLKVAFEQYKKLAGQYAGPSLIETFGGAGFDPVNKPEAPVMDVKQQKLTLSYANESTVVTNQYIPEDETSFTIIAFPVPDIGPDFPEIFDEIIKINTLDYEKYKVIQQVIIDALDKGTHVEIKGGQDNETDLTVRLHSLLDPRNQSNFENCVADVNIPLGEVFTSPVLAGTNGRLHVSSVYIGDFQFRNLYMTFQDGMVGEYGCSNFESEEESKNLVKQVIMKNHDTIPMGEFAIGTNTVAYAAAQKFGIISKLPILIVEKMGPHFAVGDTCYSWAEDTPMYNPDGKEVIARDNEVSLLRKEDVSRAYFSCHTDITIPYDELDSIVVVCGDGNRISIIEDGKFVLCGTEDLNKPLTD